MLDGCNGLAGGMVLVGGQMIRCIINLIGIWSGG